MDEEKDLYDLIPDEVCNHPDHCSSSTFWRWEQEVAEPILREKGYSIKHWFSTDEDSFGPLVRAVVVEKDGVTETYSYG